MPRQARLDAPGTLHHVIVRGIEKKPIVKGDADRNDFVARMGRIAMDTKTPIYAWALLTNHVHILLRSGPQGLPNFMRCLLTGYAIAFNRKHRRHGHLFQNRYKSILCDEDTYFKELLRYIHLNPLRANLVKTLSALDQYPWCGHGVLMGYKEQPWQHSDYVLAWFGKSKRTARDAYHNYIQAGMAMGQRPDLVGGGLARSQGGWSQVVAMRKRNVEAFYDERILGPSDFVQQIIKEAEEDLQQPFKKGLSGDDIERLIRQACETAAISPEEIRSGSRRKPIAKVRSELAITFVRHYGISLAKTARHLGVSTPAIANILRRKNL